MYACFSQEDTWYLVSSLRGGGRLLEVGQHEEGDSRPLSQPTTYCHTWGVNARYIIIIIIHTGIYCIT